MKTSATLLRAAVFPLLILAGLGLLAYGFVDWRRFYRDLYAEELAALKAFPEQGRIVYRREGDLPDHWRDFRPDEELPAGAVFAGRVEAAEFMSRPAPPQATLDRALRLPGMVDFNEDMALHYAGAQNPLSSVKILGRALPTLDPPMDAAELASPFPSGEPLGDEEQETLLAQIAAAWERDDSTDRPHLTIDVSDQGRSATLIDGDRRWVHSVATWNYCGDPSEWIRFANDGVYQAIFTEGDSRRLVERRPAKEDDFRSAFDGAASDLRPVFGHESRRSIDDPATMPVRRIERVDETRYVVALDDFEIDEWTHDRLEGGTFVVRSDLNWATERSEGTIQSDEPFGEVSTVHCREVRRLACEGDLVYAAERLADERASKDDPTPLDPSREQFAVEFDPQYALAAFDSATYGATPWPEPAPLPVVRTYRIATAAGGLALFVGVVGWLFGRTIERAAPIGTEERRRRRIGLPALRFGLATVGATALLGISGAGWIKSKLDAMTDERSVLARLAENREIGVVRRPATFPWSWFSSDSWPIDAPIVELQLGGYRALPIADRDATLRLPELRSFNAGASDYSGNYPLSSKPDAAPKLPVVHLIGRELPSVPPFRAPDADLSREAPHGEPVDAREGERVFRTAQTAWLEARAAFPQRYLVRVAEGTDAQRAGRAPRSSDDDVLIVDGVRYWDASEKVSAESVVVACTDGRYRCAYDFEWVGGVPQWRLVERSEATEESLRSLATDWRYDPDVRRRTPPYLVPENVPFDFGELEALLEGDAAELGIGPVERIDDSRWRIELTPPRDPIWAVERSPCTVLGWTLIVDENLAWSITAVEIETFESDARSQDPFATYPGEHDPFADPFAADAGQSDPFATKAEIEGDDDRDTRSIVRAMHEIEMHDGVPILVASRLRVEPKEGPDAKHEDRDVRFVYDFDPAVDERLYGLPCLDYADPPPYPDVPPRFHCSQATALAACGIFAFGLVRRIRDWLHGRSPKKASRTV